LLSSSQGGFHPFIPTTPQSNTFEDNSSDISDAEEEFIDVVGPPGSLHEASTNALINSSQNIPTLLTLQDDHVVQAWAPSIEGSSDERKDEDMIDDPILPPKETSADDESDEDSSDTASTSSTLQLPSLTPSPETKPITQGDGHIPYDVAMHAMKIPLPDTTLQELRTLSPTIPPAPQLPSMKDIPSSLPLASDEDDITDTVGAIAIDSHGNIACAASSGGIGMKHRGRVGPAALVGVGAAVVPTHSNDKSKTCVAAVTSGTGEHMGTTLAASVCADRLYSCLQKSNDGPLEPTGEEKVLRGFVEREFMMHPSVKHSNSAGAIGIVSLKKTRDAVYLHFAHNTDSFVS
jgi:taspase (threonine aspartase 1)